MDHVPRPPKTQYAWEGAAHVAFQQFGSGAADLVLEWTDDVIAVMDGAGVERATLMGIGAGGPMTMLAAASHPDRVDALVLVNTTARMLRAPDYPHGLPERVAQKILAVATWLSTSPTPGSSSSPETSTFPTSAASTR